MRRKHLVDPEKLERQRVSFNANEKHLLDPRFRKLEFNVCNPLLLKVCQGG